MDVPDLVRERLGDEEVTAGASAGDEDAVFLTQTRTLVYRSDGILSDEHVEEYPHNVEGLSVTEGRRKTKFALEYVEGPETFTVPSDRGETVLELLLQGVLRRDGVIGRRESIAGVYRFTELTLVITEQRVLKHIGNRLWDDDFENYPFDSVTGLEFERASTATSIAIEIDGRPQRVKVPNDTARLVRQTLEDALFAYYSVDSLEAFNAAVATAPPEGTSEEATGNSDIGFESGIDPLVTDSDASVDTEPERDRSGDHGEGSPLPDRMNVSPVDGPPEESDGVRTARESGGTTQSPSERPGASDDATETRPGTDERRSQTGADGTPDSASGETSHPAEEEPGRAVGSESRAGETGQSSADRGAPTADERERSEGVDSAADRQGRAGSHPTADDIGTASDDTETVGDEPGRGTATSDAAGRIGTHDEPLASEADVAELEARVEELTDAVERQNELLKRQQKALKQLVSELRSE